MKPWLTAFFFGIFLTHASAEEPAPSTDVEEGLGLMERGLRLLLDGTIKEIDPQLDEITEALRKLQPALRDASPKFIELLNLLGDIENYDPPKVLPNGDILIPRKKTADPLPPDNPTLEL